MESNWVDTIYTKNSGLHFKERKEAIVKVVKSLETEKHLSYLDFLGQGTYGDVLLMFHKKLKVKKAAKIIISKNIIPFEQQIWPKLNHINILAVEEIMTLADGTLVFITPFKFKTLQEILLYEEGFKQNYEHNFPTLKKWLRDTLTGIEFLHDHGYCHLDLKLDNVLVGSDGMACLCDFSSINYCNSPITVGNIGLADIYQPPEACKGLSSKDVLGTAVDLWGYGMLVLEACTDQHVLDNVDRCLSWEEDVQPVLESILDIENFQWEVKLTFPIYSFTDEEYLSLRQFLELFLQVPPDERKSAKEALLDNFFKSVDKFFIVLDDIYQKLGK